MLRNHLESNRDYRSNPCCDPVPVLELEIDHEGSPRDRVILKPVDNKSLFAGSHFNPSIHSLAARLNVGVPIEKVNIGCTENDPNVLYRAVNSFIHQADQNVYSRTVAEAQKAAAESSVVAPKSE